MDKPAVMHLVKQKIGMAGWRAKPLDNPEAQAGYAGLYQDIVKIGPRNKVRILPSK